MKLNPRGFGLVCAVAAIGTGLAVAGCSNYVHGTATANAAQAAAYRTEMSSSEVAISSSHKAAAQAKTLDDTCKSFRDAVMPPITGKAVTQYNDFVDAHDANAPDQIAKRDLAAQTLEDAARTVQDAMSSSGAGLPPDVTQKFTDYVNAARALAAETRKMTYTAPVGALNDASRRVNDALGAARAVCPTK